MATSPDFLILRYSGSELTDEHSFHNHLVEKISEARATRDVTYAELVYDNIAPSWMANVGDALERAKAGFCKSYNPFTLILRVVAMPSFLHNADQIWYNRSQTQWLVSGQLTQNEFDMLYVTANTEDYVFPDGPFAGICKSPNVAVDVENAIMPRIVVESGWSESLNELREDAGEWLVGGNGAVQAAIIIKWTLSRTNRRVRGLVELYTLDRSGMPRLQQREEIFKVPPGIQPGSQAIRLTRQMFFGRSVEPGARPGDVLPLDVGMLRAIAQVEMSKMGYSPA
ncbi:hypothetical protein IFM51744_05001 [Aspergillus udagawae]|nr:hypothetical protein IFM51744_05001 [Aspergillus udagawae]